MKISKARKLKDKAAHLISKDKFKKALDIYNELLHIDPKDVALMLKIGDLNRRLGNAPASIEIYSRAAERYARDGMLLRGIAVCKVILDIDPDHTATQEQLASLYTKQYGAPPKQRKDLSNEQHLEPAIQEAKSEETDGSPPAPEEMEISIEIDISEPMTEERAAENEPIENEPIEDEPIVIEEEIEIDQDDTDDGVEFVPTIAPEPEELPHIPLFSDLDRESFIDLLQRIPLHSFDADTQIASEGDEGTAFFVLVSGSVQVFKEEVSLAKLGPGAFFGEMSLVTERPRQASVKTLEPCEVLEISNEELTRLKARFPHIDDVLKRFTGQRLLHNLMLTSPLFSPFSLEERKELMRRFKPVSHAKGTAIIRQGQEGEGLYLIVSGLVDVIRETEDAVERHLTNLSEGSIFGEIALLTRSSATATVRAAHRCDMLCLPKENFNELILTHPQILMLVSDLSTARQQRNDELLTLTRELATARDGGSALL